MPEKIECVYRFGFFINKGGGEGLHFKTKGRKVVIIRVFLQFIPMIPFTVYISGS